MSLIGIGTGNPRHLTGEAVDALKAAELILIPRKGPDKADLADLRRDICAAVLGDAPVRIAEFDLPVRDASNPDYRTGVNDWHDAVAATWAGEIARNLPDGGNVALLVWGDPSLYDSTLRIARRLDPAPEIDVVPGIAAPMVLAAAHRIALNEVGRPFMVMTGRLLRSGGWPDDADTIVVMLDGDCAFQTLDPAGVTIWWGAFLGMPEEMLIAGPLGDLSDEIIARRAMARERHGWIMDTYILRRRED
jgi:precorrin-6A synthase